MSKDKEVSPGGSTIFRHEAKDREWSAPEHAETEEIEAHFAAHYGEAETVFHEIVSDVVHIDVHLVPGEDCWTLFTSGMSARPMTTPEGAEDFRFAELMIQLPRDWKLDESSLQQKDERWYWPIRWLKQLARLPHDYDTWLGAFHTIPNGDPPKPFSADTKLCCWLLLPPPVEEARTIELSDGRLVQIYQLFALHPEEMKLKLDEGAEALLAKMDEMQLSEILDPGREPMVKRKKLFGLF